MQPSPKAIIIGAGIAGIATAIRLAVHGFTVDVFEKNDHPGGKLYEIKKNGFCFDSGPSVFVQPENIELLFELAGEDINQHLEFKKLDITCRYFYEDATVINAFADRKKLQQELYQKLNEPIHSIENYLDEARRIYDDIGKIFLNHSLHKKNGWRLSEIIQALSSTRYRYLFSSLHAVNKKYFKNPKLVQLFDRFATYCGSNPYEAPGMLQLICHLELNLGSYYPKGGMMSVNRALFNLAIKKGARFHFNTGVEKIIVTNKKATGIISNQKKFLADVVISNVDVFCTYQNLLNDVAVATKFLKQERSSSALVFYWGISKSFPQLELHNIFFSKNYEEEFKYLFDKKLPYNDPTIYINITSKIEPGLHATGEKENWFVMANVPADINFSQPSTIQSYKQNILIKLSRILHSEIEPLIETEEILDPQKIETGTGSYGGALYGTCSNSRTAAFLRHSNFSKNINRLYFAGGSVHPGGGIPLCLKSAAITAEMIIQDRKKWKYEE